MTKLKQDIQGNTSTFLFKCYCGEQSYLEVMQDPDDREIYINITMHPTRFTQRLKLAWKALRGLEFQASNEIVLSDADVKSFIKALTLANPDSKRKRNKES